MTDQITDNLWPPEDLAEYSKSESFLSYLKAIADSLAHRLYMTPEWEIRDAVFDAAADIIIKALSQEEEDDPPFLLKFASEENFLSYVSKASEWRALDYAKRYHRRRERRENLSVEVIANLPQLPEEIALKRELGTLINRVVPQ